MSNSLVSQWHQLSASSLRGILRKLFVCSHITESSETLQVFSALQQEYLLSFFTWRQKLTWKSPVLCNCKPPFFKEGFVRYYFDEERKRSLFTKRNEEYSWKSKGENHIVIPRIQNLYVRTRKAYTQKTFTNVSAMSTDSHRLLSFACLHEDNINNYQQVLVTMSGLIYHSRIGCRTSDWPVSLQPLWVKLTRVQRGQCHDQTTMPVYKYIHRCKMDSRNQMLDLLVPVVI